MTVYENFEKDKELVSIPLNLQEVNACKIYSITFSVCFLKFIVIVFWFKRLIKNIPWINVQGCGLHQVKPLNILFLVKLKKSFSSWISFSLKCKYRLVHSLPLLFVMKKSNKLIWNQKSCLFGLRIPLLSVFLCISQFLFQEQQDNRVYMSFFKKLLTTWICQKHLGIHVLVDYRLVV